MRLGLLALLACVLVGCVPQPGRQVADGVTAMGGAHASGSGASITPPPAAAEPSEQHSIQEETYEASAPATVAGEVADPSPPSAASPIEPMPAVEFHASPYDVPATVPGSATPSPTIAAPAPAAPGARLLHRRSETYTRFGAQQELTPMLKQAGEFFGRLTRAHWLGLLAILVGFGGVLHAAGNKESGYPLCWLKVMGGGVLAVTMGDALWFWILCGLAALLYAAQKLGLLRPLP